MAENYAAIRQGRFSSHDPAVWKDLLASSLYSIPQVDSVILGDRTAGQFIIMRYGGAAYRSPLLASVAAQLPPPSDDPRRQQVLTRDFRPEAWGENARWAIWDDFGGTAVRHWETPMPGYDSRQRPLHRAAMTAFHDRTLGEARALGDDLVAWSDIYTLFTIKAPAISASVAARDPSGEVLVVAYDLLLD